MSKYDPFNLTDYPYKTVDDHQINLSILTPKTIQSGKYPVLVRFHGGFLVTGTRLFPDWFPNWVFDLALTTSAIVITPDYRLLPEASGIDILSDVSDLFTWLHEKLPFVLSSLNVPIEADLDRILVTGESAGGYLATQAALLHKDQGIVAAISAYGVLDIKVPFFTTGFEKIIMGFPMTAPGLLETHMEQLKKGAMPKVVSSAMSEGRTQLTMHIVQYGRYVDVLGQESECYPMENLERVGKGGLVPMWLFHGKQDTAVPVEGSIAFAEKAKGLQPHGAVKLTLVDGEHGLDGGPEVTLETPWMKDGLAFIKKAWLSDQARI